MSVSAATETIELQPIPLLATIQPLRSKSHPDSPRESLTYSDAFHHRMPDQELSIAAAPEPPTKSTLRITLAILQPSLVNFLSSFTNGVITVGLPVISRSIALPRELYLWPTSVYGLTSGAMLLLAGAIADIVGARIVDLIGIFLLGCFTLGCGLSATGVQLVIFRALQGTATSMHLPASVALVAAAVPQGRARNIGFACLGLSQPLGFSVGLVVSGVMIERAGWRSCFYLVGGAMLVTAITAIWTLPRVKQEGQAITGLKMLPKLYKDVDWVGGMLASAGLAILSYVLAVLSADLQSIHSASTACLLAVSLILLAAFPIWMHFREKAGKPALVPNELWRNTAFASTCCMVALSSGVCNSIELFSSLYFQEVQSRSILTTSLYLLPNLLTGVCLNLSMGVFVDRLPARWLVVASSLICALSPLAMSLLNPGWSYWYLEFWAQVFAPFSADVLFTVGLIIVSDQFPEKTQALAGAVFNTVTQFGMSLGVGTCQVVSLAVVGKSEGQENKGEALGEFEHDAVLNGYRAAFWLMFGYMALCALLAVFGLRKAGQVGLKRE